MRSHLALLCLGLALLCAPGVARASAPAHDPGAACQHDNLWAEQVLFAEAAFLAPARQDAAPAQDADEVRCSTERPATEDCIEPAGLSAPRPRGTLRCDVRFGSAPRHYLRAQGARPSPLERILATAPQSRLQSGASSSISHEGDASAAVLVAALSPPPPPVPTLARPDEPLGRLLPGHPGRLERPPR